MGRGTGLKSEEERKANKRKSSKKYEEKQKDVPRQYVSIPYCPVCREIIGVWNDCNCPESDQSGWEDRDEGLYL